MATEKVIGPESNVDVESRTGQGIARAKGTCVR